MVKYLPGDQVAIHGYASRPIKLPFRAWLKITDRAIIAVEHATQRGVASESAATPSELQSKRWLQACLPHGAKMSAAIACYKERRPMFDLPSDPSRIIRCKCCNIPLVDPLSKLLGIGPVCRNPQKAAPRLTRVEVPA